MGPASCILRIHVVNFNRKALAFRLVVYNNDMWLSTIKVIYCLWSCLCLPSFSLREGVRPLLRPLRPYLKRRERSVRVKGNSLCLQNERETQAQPLHLETFLPSG